MKITEKIVTSVTPPQQINVAWHNPETGELKMFGNKGWEVVGGKPGEGDSSSTNTNGYPIREITVDDNTDIFVTLEANEYTKINGKCNDLIVAKNVFDDLQNDEKYTYLKYLYIEDKTLINQIQGSYLNLTCAKQHNKQITYLDMENMIIDTVDVYYTYTIYMEYTSFEMCVILQKDNLYMCAFKDDPSIPADPSEFPEEVDVIIMFSSKANVEVVEVNDSAITTYFPPLNPILLNNYTVNKISNDEFELTFPDIIANIKTTEPLIIQHNKPIIENNDIISYGWFQFIVNVVINNKSQDAITKEYVLESSSHNVIITDTIHWSNDNPPLPSTDKKLVISLLNDIGCFIETSNI